MRVFARSGTLVVVVATALAACSYGGGVSPGTRVHYVPRTGAGVGAASFAALRPDVPILGGCQVFPADNPYNTDITSAPVDPNSANYLQHMNAGTTFLHADFGQNPHWGFPINIAQPSTAFVPIKFTLYGNESDPGPYPIPKGARIEGGPHSTGDRHVTVLYQGNCHLYEMWRSFFVGPGWKAGSGAIFDLSSNNLRHQCWTSAEASGLPIIPGLARLAEVQAGAIDHALQFTVQTTQRAYVHPATHFASTSTDPNDPPMGLRVRLKASFDLSSYHGQSLVILTALKHYGMFLGQNGSDWYVAGETNSGWSNTDLDQMKTVPASAFEVIETGTIYKDC